MTQARVSPSNISTISLSLLGLIAFAGNSILCRLALAQQTIDPASFTIIRLLSGAIVLFLLVNLVALRQSANKKQQTNDSHPFLHKCYSALALFIYASAFSYSYMLLDTGTGALILFAAVQLTLLLANRLMGNALTKQEFLGLFIAFIGLVYLVLPSLSKPDGIGMLIMLISGAAWAVYTLLGKKAPEPLLNSYQSFVYSLPLVVIFTAICWQQLEAEFIGVVYAVLSGGVTSALGYFIWYKALKNLTVISAGVIQLLVPVLAATSGMISLNEPLTTRFIVALLLLVIGVLLVLLTKKPANLSS